MGYRRQFLRSNRYYFIAVFAILLTIAPSLCGSNRVKGKRQIFREQVLPFTGGKIPESALRSDRLNLNQLQKEGFSLPDGVVLSNRRHLRHPIPYHREPEVLKVYMTDDNRYISVYGKYTTDIPDTIDTTYLIRSPIQITQEISNTVSEFPRQRVFKPSILSLIIPSNDIYGKTLNGQNEINRYPQETQHNNFSNRVKNQKVPYNDKSRQNDFHQHSVYVYTKKNNFNYTPNRGGSQKQNRVQDNSWKQKIFQDNDWKQRNMQDNSWKQKDVADNSWNQKNVHEDSWRQENGQENKWRQKDIQENSWKQKNAVENGLKQKIDEVSSWNQSSNMKNVQRTGYNGPKSRVWISRYYPTHKQQWNY